MVWATAVYSAVWSSFFSSLPVADSFSFAKCNSYFIIHVPVPATSLLSRPLLKTAPALAPARALQLLQGIKGLGHCRARENLSRHPGWINANQFLRDAACNWIPGWVVEGVQTDCDVSGFGGLGHLLPLVSDWGWRAYLMDLIRTVREGVFASFQFLYDISCDIYEPVCSCHLESQQALGEVFK